MCPEVFDKHQALFISLLPEFDVTITAGSDEKVRSTIIKVDNIHNINNPYNENMNELCLSLRRYKLSNIQL